MYFIRIYNCTLDGLFKVTIIKMHCLAAGGKLAVYHKNIYAVIKFVFILTRGEYVVLPICIKANMNVDVLSCFLFQSCKTLNIGTYFNPSLCDGRAKFKS